MEVPREKDAHGLDIHCSNVPGILSADATNLLFKKRGNLANENLFPVCTDTRQSGKPACR
jgi:hypothetical protein